MARQRRRPLGKLCNMLHASGANALLFALALILALNNRTRLHPSETYSLDSSAPFPLNSEASYKLQPDKECHLDGWWNKFLANATSLKGYEEKLSRVQANALIAKNIQCFFRGKVPAFGVLRPGIVEMKLLPLFLNQSVHESVIHMAATNAGIVPPTKKQAREFITTYVRSMDLANREGGLLAVNCHDPGAAEEKAFVKRFNQNAVHIHSRSVEPFYAGHSFREDDIPWSAELSDKVLLVVHPFSVSIHRQYYRHQHGTPLFEDARILPRLKLLKTVPAVVGIGGANVEHNWSTNLENMKIQITAQQPFDFAILGCGGYGHPLAHFIVETLNVPALYMGGGTQLLFGIRGTRWEGHRLLKTLIRPSWVHPLPNEIPPSAERVEDSAYWSRPTENDNNQQLDSTQVHVIGHDQISLTAFSTGSGISLENCTLSMHLLITMPLASNLKEHIQNLYEAPYMRGPKIVNVWPNANAVHFCPKVLRPNPNELTIITENPTFFDGSWYVRMRRAWRQHVHNSSTICSITYSDDAGVVFAPFEQHWKNFSLFARNFLAPSNYFSCTAMFFSFCIDSGLHQHVLSS